MKKIKKVLAALTGCIMSASAVSGITANAIAQWITAPEELTVPDGFVAYKETYDELAYQNSNNLFEFLLYESFKYNYLSLNVTNAEVWEETYAKYAEELNYDKIETGKYLEYTTVYLYDVPEETDDPKAPASVENKQELVEKLCAELNDRGVLQSAEYNVFFATYMNPIVQKWIDITNFTGTAEEVQAVADKYTDKATVKINQGQCTVLAWTDDALSYNDLMSMKDEIDALYADDKVGVIWAADAGESTVSSQTVDLLAGLTTEQGILYGDLNLDGRVGISDIVMLNKNINGAVIFNENQQKAADLNTNGAVDSDDLNVLMQYLINIIDTLPFAE